MRILHVTPYYRDAWAYGGIPRVVAALSRAQAERGHHVVVFTTDAATHTRLPRPDLRRSRAPWDSIESDGVCVRVFPNLSNRLAYHLQFFTPLGLRRSAKRHVHNFDVAHLHACRNLVVAWAAEALTRARVPWVLAPNGTAPIIERRFAAKRVFDCITGRPELGAERFIAVSPAEHRQLVDAAVDPVQIRVVGNPVDGPPVDRQLVRGTLRSRFGADGTPLVLFLGKLTPRKRVDVLLRACARLGPNVRLVVAGNDMGAGRSLAALARTLGTGDRVHFTGLATGVERFALLAEADCVVYPSENEVFGLVPLEALLCGTPVIVANDSGCAEIIEDIPGACRVPVGDDAALATAIQDVLANAIGWRARAQAGAVEIRRRFAAPRIAAALDEVYGEIVG